MKWKPVLIIMSLVVFVLLVSLGISLRYTTATDSVELYKTVPSPTPDIQPVSYEVEPRVTPVWGRNYLASGPGDPPTDNDTPTPVPTPVTTSDVWDGAVYARIRSANFIEEKLILGMEIKVFPTKEGEDFPSVSHEDFQNEINIHAMVRLRSALSPENVMTDGIRLKPPSARRDTHLNIENTERKFDDLITRINAIRDISDTFILKNVATEADEYGKRFVADIFFRTGGMEVNLFDNLFTDGLIEYLEE